jgi:hypothetical protein
MGLENEGGRLWLEKLVPRFFGRIGRTLLRDVTVFIVCDSVIGGLGVKDRGRADHYMTSVANWY